MSDRMVNLWIATDEKSVWFGDGKYVDAKPSTRYCVEQVSDEMFTMFLHLGNQPEHMKTISFMLYHILDAKSLGKN